MIEDTSQTNQSSFQMLFPELEAQTNEKTGDNSASHGENRNHLKSPKKKSDCQNFDRCI